jgi:small subunit ribosomal protein S2
VEQYALACNMPYVNQRWLGGMLTNFETISKRVSKMADLERQRDTGEFDAMPKKEALMNTRELDKLLRNLNGIRNLERKPDAVFVLDTKKEHIAVTEANKLGIPLVAVVDTNCDPDVIQYVIPGNDDAIRAGTLMCRIIADAVEEGRFIASRRGAGGPGPSGPGGPGSGGQAGPGGGPRRSSEEEAAIAAQQADARRQAAAAQAQREARLAAQLAGAAEEGVVIEGLSESAAPARAVAAEEVPTPAEAEAELLAETTPDVVAETTPEVAAETTPDVVAETTPEVVAETTPETTADQPAEEG